MEAEYEPTKDVFTAFSNTHAPLEHKANRVYEWFVSNGK
jgi:hypothetical protein